MLFAIHCTFAPGAFAHAKKLRLEHYAFLREVKGSIVEGGPLSGADGSPTGMLMVVQLPSIEDAKIFIAKEPYNANGFFESVAVQQWMHVLPEPTQDYIEHQYQLELASRGNLKA